MTHFLTFEGPYLWNETSKIYNQYHFFHLLFALYSFVAFILIFEKFQNVVSWGPPFGSILVCKMYQFWAKATCTTWKPSWFFVRGLWRTRKYLVHKVQRKVVPPSKYAWSKYQYQKFKNYMVLMFYNCFSQY